MTTKTANIGDYTITDTRKKSIRKMRKTFYRILCMLQKLIAIIGTYAGFMMVAAGGDGKCYDGDLNVVLKSCIIMTMCFIVYNVLKAAKKQQIFLKKSNI